MTLSIVERLALAARDMPAQQARVAQFVAENAFEATTSPMRSLARTTGATPATFTRLAQAMGFSGWDALRAELTEEARAGLSAAQRGPYSSRTAFRTSGTGLVAAMLRADTDEIASLDASRIANAAALVEKAQRVLVAGFRSCHAPATLFHYQYRLFRPDVSLLGGAGGALDLELGTLRATDALVLFGFNPYSRDSLLTARAAIERGCKLIAITDSERAPIASNASAVLTFGTNTPGFFPSLTACMALVQAFAAMLYARSGEEGRAHLREAEARIAAHTAYVTTKRRYR